MHDNTQSALPITGAFGIPDSTADGFPEIVKVVSGSL